MLVYEPTERAAAADLLNHAYVMALSTDNPTSAAASVVGSGGTAGSSLAGDTNNPYAQYTASKLGEASTTGASMDVTSANGAALVDQGADGAADNAEDGRNSKDVLRGRRTDVPTAAAKIR